MKRFLKILTAALLSVSFMGGVASAATCNGTISVTGPSSNNTISCTDVNNIVVTCTNNITTATVNYQTGTSGDANNSGNTTSGSATSGSVVNDNGSNVTIGSSCGQTAAPVTPAGGGGGGAASPAPGKGAAAPQPAVLPYTSGMSSAAIVIGSLAAAAIVVAASRLAVVAYRHFSVK